MYLRELRLENFRAFETLTWKIEAGAEAGWHVLLGPNGSGKSSFLRAAAIAFTGAAEFMAARRPTGDFVRRADGVEKATISVSLSHDRAWDDWTTGRPSDKNVDAKVVLHHSGTLTFSTNFGTRTVWGEGRGWFSAAFGPMRRFTGGNLEHLRLFGSFPRLARHLSIFGEDVALTEALEWLRQLRFKQLERASVGSTADLLERVRTFVNQPGFLPHGAELKEVSSEGVNFVDGNGVELPVVEMSDGYRAVLSMTFELIRLMAIRFGEERIFSSDGSQIVAPGVVLVDEIDAHLHPTWQRQIGPWLTRLFPQVQFVVTTHSPYVCQAAEKGSVWTLPPPGSEEDMHRLEGEQLTRALFGDVLDVLNSEAFGGVPGRSEEAVHLLDRLATLNRGLDQGTLSSSEAAERSALEEKLTPVLREEGQ